MSWIRRIARIALVALVGAAAAGCCLPPPYGWERGHHGRSEYYQGDRDGGRMASPGYGGQGREHERRGHGY